MKIRKATIEYETWLADQIPLIRSDLKLKHDHMKDEPFSFFRATFYRWAQLWPESCPELASAPAVLSVGDLHVENFGTWRDAEGRLVWGINDFDEAWPLACTQDLVRLAASAHLAIAENHLAIDSKSAADAILEGYTEGLAAGGRPFILAEHHKSLRAMAVERLKDPGHFWEKLEKSSPVRNVPRGAAKALTRALPERDLRCRIVHRIAGLGSLGRQRFVAIAGWHGGKIAREVKSLAPSACVWAQEGKGSAKILYQQILDQSVRCADPLVKMKKRWIVRRLAPDCSRIELSSLPKEREEVRLLHAMGFETANVHLGSGKTRAIQNDLKKRPHGWLHHAAKQMADAVTSDWEDWRKVAKRAAIVAA